MRCRSWRTPIGEGVRPLGRNPRGDAALAVLEVDRPRRLLRSGPRVGRDGARDVHDEPDLLMYPSRMRSDHRLSLDGNG